MRKPGILRSPSLLATHLASSLCISLAAPCWFAQTVARTGAPQGTNNIVWELRLTNGPPPGCTLQFSRLAKDAKGPFLLADSRADNTAWHSCISVPAGLLKSGQDYTITVEYQVIDRPADASYFYVFARSRRLGNGADHWERWHGESGTRGIAKLRISPAADDFGIVAGIHNQGAIQILSMTILHGDGWTTVPLESSVGKAAPPESAAGAQDFTIEPPNNKNGPVLNLADFGAVADGNSPPGSGPDRNSAALKAAIAKCRETHASKLIVPKGVYRIVSGETIVFDGLNDFIFDGGGSTFLFHQIKGGHGVSIKNCNRAVFSNFNLDWDWKIDPLASIGRITSLAPDKSFFEMRFETTAPLDPKRWVTMNPLDEKLRVPGTGSELGGFAPKRIDKLDAQTVRVWPSRPIAPVAGRLYLLRHYTYEKHAVTMSNNAHLLLRDITIFSFPGIGFIVGGDQHHFELLRCRITFPEGERRPITTTADGFHVGQSQGFIMLDDCDFGYMGDDCVNIHDNIHAGVQRVDAHTLVAKQIVTWSCPYSAGDRVEIRNGDFSPTGFVGTLKEAKPDYKNRETTLVFEQELPNKVPSDSILFNLRYGSKNFIIRNCYFHENRARGVLCNTADGLIEGNRFFHNQFQAMILEADIDPSWSEGFGARDVVVRNNSFESSNPAGVHHGAVISLSATIQGSTTHYPLVQGILLQNNTFKEMTGFAVEAASFANLVIRDNHLINREPAPITLKTRGSIRAEYGTGLLVEGNQWMTQAGIVSPTLSYDAETVQKLTYRGNLLKP